MRKAQHTKKHSMGKKMKSPKRIFIPQWQKDELDRAFKEYRDNPSASIPWSELKKKLLRLT